uniref:ELM2 domain-containing protein n=1 Tax=Panagrolaimus sp. ES5 TaxID=591445 RepID=A0AC34FC80_9BILA
MAFSWRNSQLEKCQNNYLLNLAKLPDLKKASDAADDGDRDEKIFESECFKVFTDDRLQRYIVACEIKIKCDIHTALSHLAANEYSIKKALETIENPKSNPLKFLTGKNGSGIWEPKEIAIFAERMKYHRLYKQWNAIRQYLPSKSIPNLINSYYTMKGIGYSFKKQTFSPISKRLEFQTKCFGFEVVEQDSCENCIKQLWKKQAKTEETKVKLCAFCQLYFELYGKQRPNAQVFSIQG